MTAFILCQGFRSGNVNPNRPDVCEITPLSLACARGRLDMVEILLEKGANINYNNEVRLSMYVGMEHMALMLVKNHILISSNTYI